VTKDIEAQKVEYLNIIKRIVITASRMHSMVRHELCPTLHQGNDKAARQDLSHFIALKNEQAKLLDEMRDIDETVGDVFGVVRLLGQEPDPAIRVAISVLVTKVLSSEVSDAYTVAELASLSAGRDVEGLLAVHLAFCRDGILWEHTGTINRRHTNVGALEDPSLREAAFRVLVGLVSEPNSSPKSPQ